MLVLSDCVFLTFVMRLGQRTPQRHALELPRETRPLAAIPNAGAVEFGSQPGRRMKNSRPYLPNRGDQNDF